MSELIKIIKSLNTDKDLKDFLEGILTPQEQEQIPVRIKIIKLLKSGMSQHNIAAKLGIGVGTVSRGSKMIKEGKLKHVK